jgi:shikimate kinase
VNLILCGMPASGKSTIGKKAAEELGGLFVDTDRLLEKAFYEETSLFFSCREIYQKIGEAQFRILEKKIISDLKDLNHTVISVGGGSVCEASNCCLLRSLGWVVYLKTPVEVLWSRLVERGIPAFVDQLDPKKTFFEMALKRFPLYEQLAHQTIETSEKKEEEILQMLLTEGRKHGQ